MLKLGRSESIGKTSAEPAIKSDQPTAIKATGVPCRLRSRKPLAGYDFENCSAIGRTRVGLQIAMVSLRFESI
jgi:hypothetical protein